MLKLPHFVWDGAHPPPTPTPCNSLIIILTILLLKQHYTCMKECNNSHGCAIPQISCINLATH